ncbi:hypothetical protein Agub_g10955, partial [Astrephomene gubernaculifera]
PLSRPALYPSGVVGGGSRHGASSSAAASSSANGPPAPTLSLYGSALSNCLDHLEAFNDRQLAALFDVLAAVTGGAEGVAWRAAAEAREQAATRRRRADDAAMRGVVRIPGGAGGRLETDVLIVVDKALKGAAAPYKRIGIAGALSYLRRVGGALALLA